MAHRRAHDFGFFRVEWLPRYGWVVRRGPAVVVVPVAPDDRVWLARIRRPPALATSWEVPGGAVDPGEDLLAAGLRELEEETGLVAGSAELVPPVLELAPGMGTFPHHVVLARDVVPRHRAPVPQRSEGIERVERFTREQAFRMVRRGQIAVHATVAALFSCGSATGMMRADRRRAPVQRRAKVQG